MEETLEFKEGILFSDVTGKLHEFLTESDPETGQFSFEEEMIEEVMQELYKEITSSPVTGQVCSPAAPSPSSSLAVSPLFTDKGKNGSCGASVSGISISGPLPEKEKGESDELVSLGLWAEEKKMDGGDVDEEWLGRVVCWGQGQV